VNELQLATHAPLPALVLAALAGVALGAMFFGGLWYTARRGAASTWPALWFLGSLLLRMAITLPGFYVAGGGHWDRMLACLIGFLVARTIVMRLTRPRPDSRAGVAKEVRHAP
jgi:F1F0 ATPase subunit 2